MDISFNSNSNTSTLTLNYLEQLNVSRARGGWVEVKRLPKKKKISYDMLFLKQQYHNIWYNQEYK